MLGPVALMLGLQQTAASTASLLLNLEAVMTAVLAWVAFKENADRRVVLGMLAIVAGGVILSWPVEGSVASSWNWGAGLIVLACMCWAMDNNLTRKVSASDALFIAGSKGLVAGGVNVCIAIALGSAWPESSTFLGAMVVGLLGYGISLVLFVLALRGLGTARTGAYFSVAPFMGALVSLVWLGESVGAAFWVACALMGLGVWLHPRSGMSTRTPTRRWSTTTRMCMTTTISTRMTSTGTGRSRMCMRTGMWQSRTNTRTSRTFTTSMSIEDRR
jgi:drug/metabolite transporter (DMT)-like permease